MPVINEQRTHGWYTDEEIARGVPSPRMVGGLPVNTLQWWDARAEAGRYTGSGHQRYFAEVAAQLPYFGRWCDVGCGIGTCMVFMRSWKPDLDPWGFDASPVAIEHARAHPRLRANQLAVGTLPDDVPWRGARFDVATVCEVLEHFPLTASPRIVAAAVSIAPRTIVTVPNGMDYSSGHFVWYDLDLFRSLLPPGYTAEGELLPLGKNWMFTVTEDGK